MIIVRQVSVLIAIISLLGVFYFRKQVLITLVRLEMVALISFLCLLVNFRQLYQPLSICFYMLILRTCEASLALRLLVILVRLKGGEMFSLIRNYKY